MLTYSKILFYWALSVIFGVAMASWLKISQWLLIELFLLGFFYVLFFYRHKLIVVFGCCLIFLALGMGRASLSAGATTQPAKATGLAQMALVKDIFPSPQGELFSGILFGGQQNLDYQWKQKINLAGVRHITAVSGSNIVLLSQILVWLGIALGLYRQWAVGGAAFLIWFYIFLIGSPASAIRAGVMASLLLLAGALGQPNRSQRTIVLAASVMLLIKPSLLRFDIGFQLSFLAVLGLIYLAPLLQSWLVLKIKFLERANLAQFLAINLAAWLWTLPLSIYYFGYFSLTSVMANILIAPIIPVIMLLGFLLLLAGFVYRPLAMILAWPINLLLNYFLQIVDWFSPAVLANWRLYFSKTILILCYSALGFWVWLWHQRKIEV
ncbi:MAG: ComEC/Rec2 family competence protein [Candidatus Gribaldobacteria bacterium]|nr:ComEC/Rec2 family competence protein [Candidatus Gribaldobacteria bacterium]